MRTVSFELAQKLASIGFDEYTPNAYANKTGIDYSPLANDSVFMTTIGRLIYNYEYCDIVVQYKILFYILLVNK